MQNSLDKNPEDFNKKEQLRIIRAHPQQTRIKTNLY